MKFSGNTVVISGSGGAILGGSLGGPIGAVIGALAGATVGLIASDDNSSITPRYTIKDEAKQEEHSAIIILAKSSDGNVESSFKKEEKNVKQG